ncbi:hypothetical protein ABEB36_009084 [Hypothenemus hampei]|uniref:PDZ domain-containing protein n=1 Tax=Hypothenemus hampei TaxID=57062 RepID=A0ABD1EP25_HYPHA
MQFLGDGSGYRWAEAAERIANAKSHTSTSLPRESRRKEPLGQANNSPTPWSADKTEYVVIRNQPGPLGIHVVPDYDGSGKDRGLLVQGIEPGGRIDRDGRLAIYDRIVEINGQNLINIPFQRVQEIFKLSLISPELRLKVVKTTGLESLRKPPTPIYPKFKDDKENHTMIECEQKQNSNTKIATVSPTKKVPAISKNLKGLLTANTRKIGRKIEIELLKGPRGLGFSITTRDNPAGGNCPIYIKNIIPEGAAVEDGRLRIGDRLLQVNDEEMTGKSQSEAVAILRKVPAGSKVKIIVSRQEDVPINNGLPRVIGIEETDEREEPITSEPLNGNQDVPPNIPPLPQSHLLQNNRSVPEKPVGSVAKIVSQFQEAVNSSNPPDKNDGNIVFPWKHREILTFNIPVHDSEKAGLGISVKGKTSESGDLGIFIKSVINGGAASRDKRLRTNDQLLNVNGISLLQQSNSDAMETLRRAMLHTEGPVPGNITLTIARRASSPGSSRNRSNESLLNDSQASQELYNGNSQETSSEQPSGENSNSNASNGSTNTVIYNSHRNGSILNHQNQLSPMHTWNPVLERLTGKQQLRNESYYKATHDTWSASMLANNSGFGNVTNTTLNMNQMEPILIEDEYGSRVISIPNQTQQSQLFNMHRTNKLNQINGCNREDRKDHEPDGKASLIGSTGDKSASQTTIQSTDATYASQLSLENPQGFSRDAFGRQSMSEKRHATLDAKNTDTYQRTKKLREERIKKENADKLTELGPSLGMKKSSSLESLQTMVQEIQMQEEGDPAYSYRGPSGALKVIRGKGCEESFRAAVVDPNHRNEMGARKHWLLDGPVEEREIDGFTNVRGAPRQSSLNAALDIKNKPGKKKPGLFKGIGSMFRFGKHRKIELVEPVTQQYHQKPEFDANANISQHSQQSQQSHNPELKEENHSHHSHKSHTSEGNQQKQVHHQNEKPQEQNQNLPNHNQPNVHQREPIYQRHGYMHRHAEQVQVIPENSVAPPVKYRQNLDPRRNVDRELTRQRLAHRHTYYQSDERENFYDRHPQHQNRESQYGEFGRPGSRSGITEPSSSVPFTHYVNYNELQTHISRKESLSDSQIVQMRLQVQQQRLKVEEESRKQHQYHSQRQSRSDQQLRPISNYYEYESVQSVLNNRQIIRPPNSSHNTYSTQQDQNSNVLSNRQNLVVHNRQHGPTVTRTNMAGTVRQANQPHRGPFITQVTIGEHKKNGTKV